MGDLGIPGFGYTTVEVGPTAYRPGVAGSGPAVLLLHGFPQTHYCWHEVGPALADRHTVVVCDLKGYGESRSAPGGPLGEGYDKRDDGRRVARGHGAARARAVLGRRPRPRRPGRLPHGARPSGRRRAPRRAEHRPDRRPVRADGGRGGARLLPVVPARPARAVRRARRGASAEYVVRHLLESWAATPGAITPEAADRYARAFTAEAISGICAEFRAAFHLDRPMDAADRAGGGADRLPGPRALGRRGGIDVRRTAARLAALGRRVEGGPLASGHFVPEEAADDLAASLERFLAADG